MPHPPGYGLRCRGSYTLSVTTTPVREDGTHEFFVHSVGGDTHLHTRAQLSSTGIASGGVRLKDRGEHLGPDQTFQGSITVPFGRAHVEQNPETNEITCELANVLQGSAETAGQTSAREKSSRSPEWHDLPWPKGAAAVDYELRFYDQQNPPSTTALPSDHAVLPFAEPSRLGIVITASPTSSSST